MIIYDAHTIYAGFLDTTLLLFRFWLLSSTLNLYTEFPRRGRFCSFFHKKHFVNFFISKNIYFWFFLNNISINTFPSNGITLLKYFLSHFSQSIILFACKMCIKLFSICENISFFSLFCCNCRHKNDFIFIFLYDLLCEHVLLWTICFVLQILSDTC